MPSLQVALTPPLLSDGLKKDPPVCYFRVIGPVASLAAASAHVAKLTRGQWRPSTEEVPSSSPSHASSSSSLSWRRIQAPPPPPVLPPIPVAEELSASSPSNDNESATGGAEATATQSTAAVGADRGSVTPSTPQQAAPVNTEPNTPMTPGAAAAAGEATSWSSHASNSAFPTTPYASPLVRDTFVLFDQSRQGQPAYACSHDLGLLHDPSTRSALPLPPACVLAGRSINDYLLILMASRLFVACIVPPYSFLAHCNNSLRDPSSIASGARIRPPRSPRRESKTRAAFDRK